ncbi:uncharacterized protein [Henckelia pumila]|uniref:uncharacterized protein isoform X1 n=1 Tax=Henckelia pumila TaxID=405737 RepID=UPI003C6E4F33
MKLKGSNEGIGSLIKDLEEPLESVELRINIVTEPRYAKAKSSKVIEAFRNYIEEGRLEGYELDSFWVSEGCLEESNDAPFPIDAYMYRPKFRIPEEKNGWIHHRQSIQNPNIAVNLHSTTPAVASP